jgi:DtxR family transcriptional regulator, Mn-dependent transcriptional regulator
VDANPGPAPRRLRRDQTFLAGLSDAVQDYLREIYKLRNEAGRVKTSTLAQRMGVAPPSATAMVKRLAKLGLVEHELYRGVRLTAAGERVALEVIRHHRLLELYLAEAFELGLDAVHAEADRLEHALSERLERHIDEALGSPMHDPHGDPIPDVKLRIVQASSIPLSELTAGTLGNVVRVPDDDVELLRYLESVGLVPGARVELVRAEPLRGPITVRANDLQTAITRELAERIQVGALGGSR